MDFSDDSSRGRWLETLPDLLDHCAAQWRLRIGQPLQGGFLASVFACVDAEGNQLVLKLSPPEVPTALEAAALGLWAGRGSVSLRACDLPSGALLLDRLIPGTPLPPAGERRAIELVAPVLRDLHGVEMPAQHPFPTLPEAFDSYLERVRAWTEPGAARVGLLGQSRVAALRLCSTARQTVLLHGDFLDKNLLFDSNRLVAIDPMPRVGDPCADIGDFAAGHPPARHIRSTARDLAGQLGYDPSRAERWAAIWAIGEACETWRDDSDELQEWVSSQEVEQLLAL